MKVIVSHLHKQHVYRLVYALQKHHKLEKFFTSLYFKENGILTKLFSLNKKTKMLIDKRQFKKIADKKIFLTIFPELFSKIMHKFSLPLANFYAERTHDNFVSFILNFYKSDIFIGYESQSLKSFQKIKQQGGITILDLASVHVLKQIEINEKYNYILNNFIKPKDEKIKKVKLEEFNYVDYVIVLSEFARQSCLQNGISDSKIIVVSLGIDTKLFSLKNNYNLENFEILFVAGVRYFKGIKDLIEVFKKLKLLNAQLTIVGNDAGAVKYVKNNLSSTIKYIPHINHYELKKLYHQSSIFVLPTYMDSFGQVIFEAMSCGIPVITTKNSGAPEFIRNSETGFIIDVGDKEALKNTILYFYNNRNEIRRMGLNSRNAVQELTWNNYYTRINEVMENIYAENK